MTAKTLITAGLLLFVGASVAFLIAKENGTGAEPANPSVTSSTDAATEAAEPAMSSAASDTSTASVPESATATASAPSRKVIAYYFHGNFRCATCRNLEEYSREAIMTGFPDAINSGALEWRVVNVEDAGNEHYNDDYKLVTKSVIVSEVIDGKETRWVNLDQIWQLVNDPSAFKSYVRNEVGAVLNTL